ncbi:MAG TPA: sialidase family protein [Mycobacteriales bacterium]|nr:sialidase family protein [Mycobacteriales bacterium]
MSRTPRPVRKIAALALLCLAAAAVPALTSGTSTAATATAPTYTEYDLGFDGGEPVLGYDGQHGVFYGAGTTILRLNYQGTKLVKTDVTPEFSPTTLDTIVVSDPRTGRTFVSYLALACSVMAYTDDGGEAWHQSTGCGAAAAVDHQTVGAGPVHAPLTTGVGYDGSVYYCAQDAFNGQCSVSLDGGVTFAPAVPVANTPANLVGHPFGGACSALHGHLRVAPDGTAYLPLKGCDGVPTTNNLTNSEFFGGRPSLTVSEDNGATWQVRLGPATAKNPDESDPSVAIGPKGTVYFGWQDGTNPTDALGGDETAAKVATSSDGGKTWSTPIDLSTPLGLHNVQFPEMIVGDDDRAAFSFIGTPGIGNDQDNAFRGDWHLYVATTYDAGKTWTTVDATPTNLINRGCVHMLGLAPGSQRTDNCDYRNMLDFNDIVVDGDGRVFVAYTDACAKECSAPGGTNADSNREMVVRLTCGRGLYAAKDAVIAATPGCSGTTVVEQPGTKTGGTKGTTGSTGSTGGTKGGGTPAMPATGLPAGIALVGAVLAGAAVGVRRLRRHEA